MGDGLRAQPPANGDRLESWKEIAAYLRRDVRTVQRWEQTDGLPVHRHQRSQRPIPYAYKAEVDGWWTSRTARSTVLEAPPPWWRQHTYALAGIVAVALVAALVLSMAIARRPSVLT